MNRESKGRRLSLYTQRLVVLTSCRVTDRKHSWKWMQSGTALVIQRLYSPFESSSRPSSKLELDVNHAVGCQWGCGNGTRVTDAIWTEGHRLSIAVDEKRWAHVCRHIAYEREEFVGCDPWHLMMAFIYGADIIGANRWRVCLLGGNSGWMDWFDHVKSLYTA